jgi:hypothetical protein
MRSRVLTLMCGLSLMTSGLAAQSAGGSAGRAGAGDAALASVRKGFTDLSAWIIKSAELVPADKYGFKPTPAVRSFGQLLAHSIDGYVYYCTRAAGRSVEWSDATEKGPLDRATLVRRLKEATTSCEAAHGAGARDVVPLIDNLGHASLHYGNMITYLRLMGLTPPSS